MGVVVKIPTTIAEPNVSFVSFEGLDQVISILSDWMKEPADVHVLGSVARLRDALQDLSTGDADVIMLEDA